MSLKLCKKCKCFIDDINSYKTVKHLCKSCHKDKRREYYLSNKKKELEYAKKYQKQNPSVARKANTKWGSNNKDRVRETQRNYAKLQRTIDPMFRLADSLRARTRAALKAKRFNKISKLELYLGCSCSELKDYLESKFQPKMTWDNHGLKGWHIDHIIPLSSANSTEELYKLCHYTNLQPLWAKDNIKKSNKLSKEQILMENIRK